MSSRIDTCFSELARQGRAGLVTFVMAGDPDLATSLAILKALPSAGADVIELGMPFTDPMADGPAIQAAGLRALAAGTTLAKTLALAAKFRQDDQTTPLVLMGYYNPIYVYGVARFLADAQKAGVDGVIVVDLPPEEDAELCLPALDAGLAFIRLATPTTDAARLPAVLANTSGFVYYVSITGITGAAAPDYTKVAAAVGRLKEHTHLPVAVGFGVKNAASAAAIAAVADGVVVGSALVEALRTSLDQSGKATQASVVAVADLVRDIAQGVHSASRMPAWTRLCACRPKRIDWRAMRGAKPHFVGKTVPPSSFQRAPMNWIANVVPPKIRSFLRRETPENLWVKCPDSGELIFHKDLETNLYVVPGSGYHMRMPAKARCEMLFDDATYDNLPTPEVPLDPLKFRDVKRYTDRLKEYRQKTGANDAVRVCAGRLEGMAVTVAIQDFEFLGGSLGMAAGEAIITGMMHAVERRTPFIIFTASGGARMQEGMFSLMQMPRTTVAVQRLRAAKLPYIVVLTNPTTGGVTASYAMLGDVHIAEPGAVIGFAGARVIEQTIRERLPEGFQRAEYLQAHGMVDMVVRRHDIRATLARLCALLMHTPALEHDAA